MKTSSNPLISIIIATYNASHLLKYAIKSVLDSDYDHFELLVIGDCCTDDTEQCVASFEDDRIHFYNLEKNSGYQSTPHNFGLKKAKGEYIAYLNQDDLYLPHHLSSCLAFIRQSRHQIVCVPHMSIHPCSKEELINGNYDIELFGTPPNGAYTPLIIYAASSWFFEKSIIKTVGYWKTEYMMYGLPSQEWLFRAWKMGISIGFSKKISVIMISSGIRKNSYLMKESYEHKFFFNRLRDVSFVSDLYERVAVTSTSEALGLKFFQPVRSVKRALLYPLRRVILKFGINPRAVKIFIRYRNRKKGEIIKRHRTFTGAEST